MAKVLTVDDSKVVRTMVTRHLQPYGCVVVEATNGQEGVEAAIREQPDLVLLDVTMPVMDGKQCLAAIRADERSKGIPVIMLTAESGKDLVVEIAKLGVKGYIVKPFSKETFEAQVSKVLGPPPADGVVAAAVVPPPVAAPLDSKTVLVVDDSTRILEAAKNLLGASLTVHTAEGSVQAVELFRAHRPAVAVIDLAMPEVDGFQTLSQIRGAGGEGLLAIALSVRGDADAKAKAMKAGFIAVVEKPIQADELTQVVMGNAAAAGMAAATGGDVVMTQEQGCPVIVCPDPQSKQFAKFVPAVQKTLRALAEDGNDKLILDLATITQVNTGLVRTLVELIGEAGAMGMRTAVCAPGPVVENLKQFSETDKAVYGPTREAVRSQLA